LIDEAKLKTLLADIVTDLGKLVEPNTFNETIIKSILDKIETVTLQETYNDDFSEV
jgi:hypothetical protein